MSEALQDAIERCNMDEVHFILASGLSVNRPLQHGQTPLNMAIALGLDAMAADLIETGANVHQADSFRFDECRRRPVHYAAATGTLSLLKTLLAHGVGIEEEDDGSSTPVHHAAANGQEDIVKFLLCEDCNVNHSSKSGRTALWKAAQSGQRHITRLLLAHGASINVQNRVGQSMLFDSIRTSHAITVDLVRAGINLGLRDVEGNNVLHAAAMLGKTRAVQLLLERGGPDMVYAVNEYGNTPLHNAAMHDRLACTTALLNNSRPTHYDSQNMNGQSALYLSMVHKNERIVTLLHLAGATLSTRELNMYRDFEAHKYEEKFKFFEWAYGFFVTPLSLTSLARIAIRSHLRTTPQYDIPHLPLPLMLKGFLLLNDLANSDAITKCLDQKTECSDLASDSDGEDEIVCDICEKLLSVEVGSRWYKCTACDDYDLCTSCHRNQVHVEHRTQLHVYRSQGAHADRGCFSCGQLLKVVDENAENIMYACSVCEDVMMCQSCVSEGMHIKHKDELQLVNIPLNDNPK